MDMLCDIACLRLKLKFNHVIRTCVNMNIKVAVDWKEELTEGGYSKKRKYSSNASQHEVGGHETHAIKKD